MKSHRVLIVDDDVDICHNARDILEEHGYSADVAHDGAAAMKMVENDRYDIALLDYRMPDTDGAALYEKIRDVQPSLVAIMITAYAGSDGVTRAKDAGTWRVLRKPVNFSQLLDLIQQAVNQPLLLLVDDDRDCCRNLWSMLREQDIRVAVANDNESAVELVKQLDLQIVLLDIHLGSELCTPVFNKLQSLVPMPPTLLITDDREQQDFADELVAMGAKGISQKPLEMDTILAQIRSFLDAG